MEGRIERGDRGEGKWRDKRKGEFSSRIEGGSIISYHSPFKSNIETVKTFLERIQIRIAQQF